jgi:hypothetical protein
VTTGKNESDRRGTNPIEWSMYFLGFVTVLQCESEIVGQLLLLSEQFNNTNNWRYYQNSITNTNLNKCTLLHQFDNTGHHIDH